MNKVIEWAKKNPTMAGVAVFVVGIIALYFLGFFSSGSSGDNGNSAYYGAVVADAQAGAAQQLAETNANAAVKIAQIQGDTQLGLADRSVTINKQNTDASTAQYPYLTQIAGIQSLTALASTPPAVTTQKSNGFFGIGGGTKTVVTQSPIAIQANASLQEFLDNLHF